MLWAIYLIVLLNGTLLADSSVLSLVSFQSFISFNLHTAPWALDCYSSFCWPRNWYQAGESWSRGLNGPVTLLASEQVPFLWYFQLIISLKIRLFHYVFEYVSVRRHMHMSSGAHRGHRSWIPLVLVCARNLTLVPWKSSIILLKAEPSTQPLN